MPDRVLERHLIVTVTRSDDGATVLVTSDGCDDQLLPLTEELAILLGDYRRAPFYAVRGEDGTLRLIDRVDTADRNPTWTPPLP